MSTDRDLGGLLAGLHEHFAAGRWQALVDDAERAWTDAGPYPPTRQGADACRLAMTGYYQLADGGQHEEHYLTGYVWRVRTLVRAAESGWMACVLVIAQSEALRIQSAVNAPLTTEHPDYRAVPEALTILEELVPYVDSADAGEDPRAPSMRVVGRLYHEKRAFLEATARQYAVALEHYERALAYCGEDLRAELKVLGGRANVLAALGAAARHAEALDLTREVRNRAHAAGLGHIERTAADNATRIARDQMPLVPYETL